MHVPYVLNLHIKFRSNWMLFTIRMLLILTVLLRLKGMEKIGFARYQQGPIRLS